MFVKIQNTKDKRERYRVALKLTRRNHSVYVLDYMRFVKDIVVHIFLKNDSAWKCIDKQDGSTYHRLNCFTLDKVAPRRIKLLTQAYYENRKSNSDENVLSEPPTIKGQKQATNYLTIFD